MDEDIRERLTRLEERFEALRHEFEMHRASSNGNSTVSKMVLPVTVIVTVIEVLIELVRKFAL